LEKSLAEFISVHSGVRNSGKIKGITLLLILYKAFQRDDLLASSGQHKEPNINQPEKTPKFKPFTVCLKVNTLEE